MQMQQHGDAEATRGVGERRLAPEASMRRSMQMNEFDAPRSEDPEKLRQRANESAVAPPESARAIGPDDANILLGDETVADIAFDDAAHAARRIRANHELHLQSINQIEDAKRARLENQTLI